MNEHVKRTATEQGKIDDEIRANILHMTGCGRHILELNRGYRNYFVANMDSDDFLYLQEAERRGLVWSEKFNFAERSRIFFATKAGCEFAHIDPMTIERIDP